MFTANAIITDVIVDQTRVWLQLSLEDKVFPVHYEFDVAMLNDLSKMLFLIKHTKASNIEDLRGKTVRVVDTEEVRNSLVAIGADSKNKFIDLYGDEYPISEKRLYRRYQKKQVK